MLAVSSNSHSHGSMGRMLSASFVARGLANRVALPANTTTHVSDSSSSSESCYSSSAMETEESEYESSRAEVAQRISAPQRRAVGPNITSSNGLVLPWRNGAGCTIITTSSTRIPGTVPTAAARGSGKKKKPPGLPVSLNTISKDLSKGINPSQFIQQNGNPIVNNNNNNTNAAAVIAIPTLASVMVPRNWDDIAEVMERGDAAAAAAPVIINEPQMMIQNERSRVQAMLAEQKAGSPSSSSEDGGDDDDNDDESSSLTGKRNRIPKKSASKPRKRRKRTPPRHSNSSSSSSNAVGNPSSNEDIEEDEFFQRSGSSSSGSDDDDEDRPNFYRVRSNRGGGGGGDESTPEPANPRPPVLPPHNLCFGCMWGHRQFDRVASTKLNRLAEIFDSHFLTSEPRELAHLIYLYYQAEIYLPGSKGGKRFPEWTEGQILIHIEEHILEPRVFVAKSIRKCIKVQRALEMFFFEEDEETRRRTYNEKAMRLWLMFNKRQMDLHNCDCKHMFGYSESMRIDPSQLSRVVHADRYEVVSNSSKRGRSNIYS